GLTVRAKIRVDHDALLVSPRTGRPAWLVFSTYSNRRHTWNLYGPDGSGPRQVGLPEIGDISGSFRVHSIAADRAFFHATRLVPMEVQGRMVKAAKGAGYLVDISGVQGKILKEMENAWA